MLEPESVIAYAYAICSNLQLESLISIWFANVWEFSPFAFTPFAAMSLSGFVAEEPCFKILFRGVGALGCLGIVFFLFFWVVLILLSRHLFDFNPSICLLLFARWLQQILVLISVFVAAFWCQNLSLVQQVLDCTCKYVQHFTLR